MSEIRIGESEGGLARARSPERGQLLLDVSNAVVRVHKEYYGKGPTKARSHLLSDVLVVVLEGGLTRSEHSLLSSGHMREVAESRVAMRSASGAALREAVEAVLGRRIRSYMSANDPDADAQVEVFLLEPQGQHEGDEPELS